jgi:excisionase family DNA binding protein
MPSELGYTVDEVADRLGTSRSSVYRLIRARLLEHHDYPMIGKRITEAQLDRFLDGHVVPAEPAARVS